MKCKNCGNEFVPKTTIQIHCSKNCCNRYRCKRYHARYRKKERARKLAFYFKSKETEQGLLNIREINYKANIKRRFGELDRKKFIQQFQEKCVFCGRIDKKPIIHHLDNKGRNIKNPNNDVKNMVLCCHSCHAKIHLLGLQMKRKSDTPSNRR